VGDLADFQFVRKTATETVTSSTTLQDDDHLTVALEANTTYEFDGALYLTGSDAGDIKIAFTVPAGAAVMWGAVGLATTAAGIVGDASLSWFNVSGSARSFANGAGTGSVVFVRGVVRVGATAGDLHLQWAQNTSDGTATSMWADSNLIVREVA
jgi:hypothetical protein